MKMKNKINEVKEIWNTNAAFWDSWMDEGNDFHRLLVMPNQLENTGDKKGEPKSIFNNIFINNPPVLDRDFELTI